MQKTGFTLIETIAVIMLMAILTVVATTFFKPTSYRTNSVIEEIKAHIRYAQAYSMNSNIICGVYIPDGTHYTIFTGGNTSQRVTPPGGDSTLINLSIQGLTLSGFGTGIISFDSLGKPYTDAPATVLQSGTRSITITDGDGNTGTIQITQNTGYIP